MNITAEAFNKKYPVGTRVKYYPYHGSDYFKETVTLSEAWGLAFGGPLIKIAGNSGGINLERLEIVGSYECRRCRWIGEDEGKKSIPDLKHSKRCGAEVNLLVCPNCGGSVFNLIQQEAKC